MPDLVYELGNPAEPVGHAFLYFTVRVGDPAVAATYIVVPPVAIDFSRYVPPLLASSLGSAGLLAQAAFLPVPPVPEQLELRELRRLARRRGDDILVGGTEASDDVGSLMVRVAEIGDAYARAYQYALSHMPELEPEAPAGDLTEASALLYSVLSEAERLEELSRQVGRLRYALEGNDRSLAEATRAEMRAIAAYLPEKYQARELIDAAGRPGPSGARLAELYIARGYKLAGDSFEGIGPLDAEIASLRHQLSIEG